MEISVAEAREVISKAFKEDPHFKFGYIANIAEFLHDRGYLKQPLKDKNDVAEAVLDLIFEG